MKSATIIEFWIGNGFIWKKVRKDSLSSVEDVVVKAGHGKLSKEVEEDLLAEVQRLRAENEYLKNLQALVLEQERRQHKKRW